LIQNEINTVHVLDFSQALRDDVKYQDITYYKWDRHESICSKQNVQIDIDKALSEMENLDWTFSHNHIGFKNRHTNETIQFIKLDSSKWYVENLIDPGKWNGYLWYSESNSEHMYEMTRLFFEEVPWAHVLHWKLKRIRQ